MTGYESELFSDCLELTIFQRHRVFPEKNRLFPTRISRNQRVNLDFFDARNLYMGINDEIKKITNSRTELPGVSPNVRKNARGDMTCANTVISKRRSNKRVRNGPAKCDDDGAPHELAQFLRMSSEEVASEYRRIRHRGLSRLDVARKSFEAAGVTMKQFYMVTGQYDMVAILEGPADAAIARAILGATSQGTATSETCRAFTEDEYRQICGALA